LPQPDDANQPTAFNHPLSPIRMTTLYLIRHAESVANADNLLAGRIDYPTFADGKTRRRRPSPKNSPPALDVDLIWCSPLLRAQQTAAPFIVACNAPLRIDERIAGAAHGTLQRQVVRRGRERPGLLP
jgi:broad specificity phosphatase PhoE